MQSEATITFTQPGVQPPVYVVTSLSTPPWEPLEMKTNKEKTPSGDFVFEQKFPNIAEGSYQYKIRIGEGHWVVDDSKESATDEHGNRNNVVHVKPTAPQASLDRPANVKDMMDRKDSTIDTHDLSPAPVPFVVIEKVEDKAQPEYGDVQPKSLTVDETKRAADPEPDFEETKTDSPSDREPLQSPDVPSVVIEKVDDKPAHGDDFGEDATEGQKLARELRSADALPDRLIISPEEPDDLEPPDAQAPLFRHESFQDSADSLPEPPMDMIEEESTQYSTDHTSSGDVVYTPSAQSQDDLQDSDELDHGPRLSHETGPGAEATDEVDDIFQGPLLPHETGSTSQAKQDYDDYDEDESDAAPLLPHETGSSSYKDSASTSKKTHLSKDEYDYEPEQFMRYGAHSDGSRNFGELNLAPTFSHEQDLLAEDYSEPLLPHERGSAVESLSGSERSFSISPTTYERPAFQQTDNPRDLFGGSTRHAFFRTRTSSSSLPNKLPQSDAEDTNLHDPGLEVFPVGREQILERVATIGHKLPEDETHGAPASPQPSVLSQACSSVDLVPVKSYISLASVREDEEEEDEEDNADVESIGSPVIMSHSSSRFSRERDPLATPHPDDSKRLGFIPEDKLEGQSAHATESSEASRAPITGGVKDSSRTMKGLSDIVASKATVMNTLTPPLTPRTLEALDKGKSTSFPESEPRRRRVAVEEPIESSTPISRPEDSKKDEGPSDNPSTGESVDEKLSLGQRPLQSWKGASIGISTLVAVGAICYFLAILR